jgi:hypothetical protein
MKNMPAFPTENKTMFFHGMTLRDYFAAKAMQAMLASPELMVVVTADQALGENARERIATLSYRYADAMLKARED